MRENFTYDNNPALDEKTAEERLFKPETFSPEVLNNLIRINQELKRIAQGLDVDAAFSAVRAHLETLPWKARFTSGEVDQSDDNKDSLYYMTSEGSSIRLKRKYMSSGDINRIIQPFSEKTFFVDEEGNIYPDPKVGLWVVEILTRDFFKLQNGEKVEGPFESKVRLYKKPTGRRYVDVKAKYMLHEGSRVNKIL